MGNDEFLIEEYRTLRKEIERAMAELASLERNCVVATAAIYAWLVTVSLEDSLAHFAWSIPILLSIFGALRSLSVGQHLVRLHTYIQKIEAEVFEQNKYANGWERFLAETQKVEVRTRITALFWLSLVAVTTTVAIYAPTV